MYHIVTFTPEKTCLSKRRLLGLPSVLRHLFSQLFRLGRKAGSVEDFNYSDANKNSGIVWEEPILRKYLADPQSMVPGTKMTFPGLKDPKQIEDVIAYLKEATKPQ